MGFAGARVLVESEKMETFLDNAFEDSLEEIFFFFGSVVTEVTEEDGIDTGFGRFEAEGFTRRGINDAVVDAGGMIRLVIVGRGLVGDIIMNLIKDVSGDI